MAKTKTVRMPAGIRNKLTAAIAMLLVSSIMMVSSTYAWFTLSTAPEVTGITTSVGANGNLEMALLNTETYGDLSKITSAVGSSSAVQDVTKANITWGNLVDLSHNSYGLNLIALNPAAPNYPTSTDTDGKVVEDTTMIGTTALLKTAVYGSDGRVSELKENTVSGIYDSTTAKWVVSTDVTENGTPTSTQTRGVRAIGVDSNMTTAEIVLNAAKANVNSGKTGASAGVANAVTANTDVFVNLVSSDRDTYSPEELKALKEVAEGVETSLNSIVKVYSNAALASLAVAGTVDDDVLTKLRTDLSNNTDASALKTLLNNNNISTYDADLTALATAQSEVDTVLDCFSTDTSGVVTYVTGTKGTIKEDIVIPLIGTSKTVYAVDTETWKTVALSTSNASVVDAIYIGGGLVSTVADYAGTYRMATYIIVPIYAAVVTATTTGTGDEAVTTVSFTDTANLDAVAKAVSEMKVENTDNAERTIADFYGYIIDFAFRTNAASSFLKLQTTAANRVYSDGGAATMGGGSTVTFDYTGVDAEQVSALLGAVKLMFINPEDGFIHATAKLSNVQFIDGTETATADVILDKTTVTSDTEDVSAAIMNLNQNDATKLSVMVYLDGTVVDNSAVANGASSGILNLNLQFSSSANLVPMENSALKNMAESEGYTVTYNANGGTGADVVVSSLSGTYTLLDVTDDTIGFTRDGYTFKGWGTTVKASATEAVTTVTKATTVYAIWEVATTDEGDDTNSGSGTQTTTYNVTINGSPQDTGATYGEDYTFTADATPTVLVGTNDISDKLDHTEGTTSYTIPAANVTGDITITFNT